VRRARVRYAGLMLRARTLAASVLFVVLGIAGDARADLISDEEAQCQQATEGAACELAGKPGVCAKSTCSRNDYSDGPPPKQKSVDCMVCTPKSEVPTSETKATLSTTETKTAADTKTPSGESKPATTSKSGCASAGTDTAAWQLGCIVLGLGVVALGRKRAR
jgi:hypothetical protein